LDAPELLADADFEQVQVVRAPGAAALAILAVHHTALGPAHGGIRRARYATFAAGLADALRLAEAMTWKCALASVAAGGGKAVIFDRPGLDRRAAYRLVGTFVEQMAGRFWTGPDAGTDDDDLREVARVCRYVASPDADGPGDLALATAQGVFAAMQAVATRLGCGMRGLRVAVQGLGRVGGRLCELLAEAGARLTVADLDAGKTQRARAQFGAEVQGSADLLRADCDVLAPCAMGGVLDAAMVGSLRARAVCGAANNVLADERAGALLHARGILLVPDFVANAGALIQGACWNLTGRGPEPGRIERIGATAGEILDRARSEDSPPPAVALRLARERVAAAGTAIYLPRR
jgi:leucine dehydrogenase